MSIAKPIKRTARLDIRYAPELHARLVSAAAHAGLTVTAVVEAGIEREVRKMEKARKEAKA